MVFMKLMITAHNFDVVVCVFNEFLLPILLLSELTHNLQEFILQPFFWKHNLITSAFYFSSDFLTHTPRLN